MFKKQQHLRCLAIAVVTMFAFMGCLPTMDEVGFSGDTDTWNGGDDGFFNLSAGPGSLEYFPAASPGGGEGDDDEYWGASSDDRSPVDDPNVNWDTDAWYEYYADSNAAVELRNVGGK